MTARVDRRPDRTFQGILLIALLARAASIIVFHRNGFPFVYNEHWDIATNLYQGRGFAFGWYGLDKIPVAGSFLPPLYAAILYLLLLVSAGRAEIALVLARVLNVLLGTVTVYLVGRLAEISRGPQREREPAVAGNRSVFRRFLRNPKYLAASAWALYPPALGHAVQAHTQTLETFLMVLLVFAVLQGLPRTEAGAGPNRAVLPGLTLGVYLLARPNAGLIWILWGAYLLWRGPHRAALGRFFAVGSAVALLAVAPWTVRNWRVHHHLVPISTNGGFNFYLGNNPRSERGNPPLYRIFSEMPESDQQEWRGLSEVERDSRFYGLGRQFWRDEPVQALRAVGHRVVEFAFFRAYLLVAYSKGLAALIIASYLAILLPFLLALPRCRGPACSMSLIAIAVTGLTSCLYVISMRFRATVEPLLVVIAAGRLPRSDS